MGLLKPLSRELQPVWPERLPNGCFTLHRGGQLVASAAQEILVRWRSS